MKALNDYLIVEYKPKDTVTEGGLLLPDNADAQDTPKAVIVSIGSDVLEENGYEVGQTILVHESTGFFRINGKVFHAVKDENVIAVLD